MILEPLWRRNQLGKKSFRQWTVAGKRFAAPSLELQPIWSVTDCKESSQPSGWETPLRDERKPGTGCCAK